jgi:hypothetical protein
VIAVPAWGDIEIEYAQITVAGGNSEAGRYSVQDSVTLCLSGEKQSSARFQVTTYKGDAVPATSGVKNWKSYQN